LNFPSAWTETRLRTNWANACQKALGRHLPLYARMKHTFATNVIAGGGAESDLKDYLGHKDIRSTRRYVRAAKQRYGSIQSLGLTGPNAGSDAKSETGTEGER
jgi:integrase